MQYAQRLLSTRGGTIILSVLAGILAAAILVAYLHRYRASVRDANVPVAILTAKSLIQKGTPGLRRIHAQRVIEALGGETDLLLVTAMEFDDRAALDAGLRSDAMRAAGRNLREIAPGLSTLLVLEDAPDVVPEIGA